MSNDFGGSNELVHDATATWANSAAAGSTVNVDIPLPARLQMDAKYAVTVTNPSTETALTVRARNKETLGGAAKYPQAGADLAVAANTPDGNTLVVEGWLLGEAGRLSLSNNTVIGVAGGFTAQIRVRKL